VKGKIAYRFKTPAYPGSILYVNLIARYACVNDCLFCSRPRNETEAGKPNIYEKKAESFLFLPRAPSIDEIMDSIHAEIKEDDSELAIIGLGEPLIYLPTVAGVVKRVKSEYGVKARVDTNGLAKCMYNDPVEKLEEAGLDEIRISLNAINEQEYNQLCRSKFQDAFPSLVSFVRECVASSIDTYVSFVVGFESQGLRERTEYVNFALSLGVRPEKIIFRDYVKPITNQ